MYLRVNVAIISKTRLSLLNNKKLQLTDVACGLCGKYYGKFHLSYKKVTKIGNYDFVFQTIVRL